MIYASPTELEHYGVLGMKWGVRRTQEQLGHPKPMSERKRRKERKKFIKTFNANVYKAYNRAADYANTVLLPDINSRYPEFPNNAKGRKIRATYKKYIREYCESFNNVYLSELRKEFGTPPDGMRFEDIAPMFFSESAIEEMSSYYD